MIDDGRNRYNAIHSGQNRCINPGFSWVRISRSLVVCVVFVYSLCCLLRLLCTPYVHDNDMCEEQLNKGAQMNGFRSHTKI